VPRQPIVPQHVARLVRPAVRRRACEGGEDGKGEAEDGKEDPASVCVLIIQDEKHPSVGDRELSTL